MFFSFFRFLGFLVFKKILNSENLKVELLCFFRFLGFRVFWFYKKPKSTKSQSYFCVFFRLSGFGVFWFRKRTQSH